MTQLIDYILRDGYTSWESSTDDRILSNIIIVYPGARSVAHGVLARRDFVTLIAST
jgi:hypothetical protein